MHRIFVYGTLKTGLPNYHFLQNKEKGFSRLIGAAKTVDKFPMVIDSPYHIPFILSQVGQGNNISGEVYEVDDSMLAVLDEIESHPHLYRRTWIEVKAMVEGKFGQDEGEVLKCECYILHDFKPEMLNKPYIANYQLSHSTLYVAKADRKCDISLLECVKLVKS